MITKEQLHAMSDFEVSKALAVKLGFRIDNNQDANPQITTVRRTCDSLMHAAFDYCNTPNDIMPLAFEHKISIFAYQDATLWVAQHYFDSIGMNTVIHKNPLRAIACCLILVLQGEKE